MKRNGKDESQLQLVHQEMYLNMSLALGLAR